MREMKDSGIEWIGQIPTNWDVVPHKRVMHKVKEICEQYNGEDIISLTMNGVIKRDLTAGGKMPTSFDGYQYVKPNDLLLCLFDIDVTPRCVGVVKDYGVTSPAYSRFVIHDGYYNAYYDYLLRAIDDDKVFVHLSKNLRSSLTENDFGAIKTCVPPLAEQERIAAFLDAECAEIDAVLEKTRASIEEYKRLKQAVITQAVTKGIRGDRPMKDSGIEWIGDIPAEWNKDKVIRVFSVIGSGTTPKSSDENLFDGNTPWIQSGDINGENLFVTKNCVSNSAIESYSALRVYQAPYLVVAMYGASVGNLSLSMIDACVNQACCVLKKPTINLKFSFYIFKAVKDYLVRKAVGGGQPNISQETIKQLWLPIPSADEQIEISNYLDEKCNSVDALIAKKQQYLTEIENYKKSLIYEYVTGKKEVV